MSFVAAVVVVAALAARQGNHRDTFVDLIALLLLLLLLPHLYALEKFQKVEENLLRSSIMKFVLQSKVVHNRCYCLPSGLLRSILFHVFFTHLIFQITPDIFLFCFYDNTFYSTYFAEVHQLQIKLYTLAENIRKS